MPKPGRRKSTHPSSRPIRKKTLRSAKAEWQCQNGDEGVILLAEDNEDDVMLLERAFAKANFLNPVLVVHNGEQTIAYLQGEGKYVDRKAYPIPTLLLLDLKMPVKNGLEVLEWISRQPSLSRLRVVVLTNS